MAEFGERNGREAEEHDGTQSRDVLEPVCGTGDPTVIVPRGLRCSNPERRKKLVLHVDLNNTILVSDSVIAQGTVAALDHFLSTVTWGRMSKGKLRMNTFLYHTRITQGCVSALSAKLLFQINTPN